MADDNKKFEEYLDLDFRLRYKRTKE